MRCLSTTICLGLCLCVTPLMFAPFDPFHCFVPNQFEPVATVTVYGHCKQSLTHEVNQCRHKRDRQQDAEDLQNGEKLLIEGGPKDCALLVMAARGTMISSLPPACRQAETCRGRGARSTCSRSRTVCARMRCLNVEAVMSSQSSRSEANFPLLQSSSRFSTSSTETTV